MSEKGDEEFGVETEPGGAKKKEKQQCSPAAAAAIKKLQEHEEQTLQDSLIFSSVNSISEVSQLAAVFIYRFCWTCFVSLRTTIRNNNIHPFTPWT